MDMRVKEISERLALAKDHRDKAISALTSLVKDRTSGMDNLAQAMMLHSSFERWVKSTSIEDIFKETLLGENGIVSQMKSTEHEMEGENFIMVRDLDVTKGIAKYEADSGRKIDAEAVLVGMHKVRYLMKGMPRDLRQQSLDWLRDRGHKTMNGTKLPDQLPE
jgi:hypothetical protein